MPPRNSDLDGALTPFCILFFGVLLDLVEEETKKEVQCKSKDTE